MGGGSSRGGRRSGKRSKLAKGKPPLSAEHLKFARMVLKAGLACALRDGEETESSAACCERVAADLLGLTSSVAAALTRELGPEDERPGDEPSEEEDALRSPTPALVREWCEFYSDELLPETRKFVRKASNKLDAYGMYLPSRPKTTLSRDLLERGLSQGTAAA